MTSPIQSNTSTTGGHGVAPMLSASGEPIESVDLSLDGDVLDVLDTFEDAPMCDWTSGAASAPTSTARTPLSRLAQSADETELVHELRALASDPSAPGTAARTALDASMSPQQLQVFLNRVSLNDAAREEMMQLLGESGAIQHVAGRYADTDGSIRPPRTNGVANPMPWTPDGLREFMQDYNVAEATRFVGAYEAYRDDYKTAVDRASNPLELRALGAPVDSHEHSASSAWPDGHRRDVERVLNRAGNSFSLHTDVTNKLHALAGDARTFEFAVAIDASIEVAGIELGKLEATTTNIDRFETRGDVGEGVEWNEESLLDPAETFEISTKSAGVGITQGANLDAGEVYTRLSHGRSLSIPKTNIDLASAEVGVTVHLKIGPEFRELDAPSFWRMSEEQLVEQYMVLDDQPH